MRWFIVIGAALMLALIMGTLVNGLTAFFIPMELAEGWKRADTAAINSFGLLGLALGSAVMGFVADRIGLRAICVTASVVMSACLMVASQVTAPWQASLVFFFAGVFAGGAIFAPLFAALGNWFPGMAGVAIGIAAAEGGLGDDADDAPPPPVVPISRTGDLWRCGEHRLLCGDATMQNSVQIFPDSGVRPCRWTARAI